MAAWYIFNSSGFYPVTPGTGEYVIGMPLMDKAVVLLSNGKELTIETTPNRPQQQFIHKSNGWTKNIRNYIFTHQDLLKVKWQDLSHQLGIVPHPKKYRSKDLPFSLSNDN